MTAMMKAAVFVEKGRIALTDKPIPDVGPNDALVRITTTTICGTDVHILKGEYPVAPGLTVGHEPVGVIEKLGSAVQGYQEGQRVIAGAICPNFNSYAAQDGYPSQDGSYLAAHGLCGCHGYKATAGWRFGNLIDGTQAEYVLVPDAQANLAPIPDGLTDEQVLMCPDIMSTGFKGAENANIKIGDTVVVLAQGPIGLCATAGARLLGATTIIAVDGNDHRLGIARKMGADVTLNFRNVDVVDEVMKLTGGKGADSSIEALGTQATFAQAMKVLKPGGVLGVVDHRADPDRPAAEQLKAGYLREDDVIALFEKAGFRLVARAEIAANPRDTKDHPQGVWTLPPSLRLKDVDRARYLAIGESDKFTLKFVKIAPR